MPRIERTLPRLTRYLTFIIIASDTRLSKIVESRPYEVTEDIAVIHCHAIVTPCISGITLRLHHRTVGHTFVVAFCLENHVVITHDIMLCSQWVVDIPITIPSSQSRSDRTMLRILLTDTCGQQMGGLHHFNLLAFNDLVADTPTEDARVQTVTTHHRIHITLPPLIEKRGVVIEILVLMLAPAVEDLVNDQ